MLSSYLALQNRSSESCGFPGARHNHVPAIAARRFACFFGSVPGEVPRSK